MIQAQRLRITQLQNAKEVLRGYIREHQVEILRLLNLVFEK